MHWIPASKDRSFLNSMFTYAISMNINKISMRICDEDISETNLAV
jgi:hypothetical protein